MDGFVTWARVEPHARTTDLDVGLAAEVADPLWLLLRQYQLGELTGDDAGSPVAIDVASSWSRFSRYRADGAATPADPQPVTGQTGPLERLVESEPVIRLGADPRGTPWTAAVRAGRSLRRRLVAAGLGAVADRLASAASTTFTADAVDDVVESFDDARYRALLANRTVDGAKVLALVRGPGLPAAVVEGADADALGTVLTAWETDLVQEWGVSDADDDRFSPAWVRDRLEYDFSVAAPALPGSDAELVLSATEYDGTGIGWYSLDRDVSPGSTLGAAEDLAADPSLVGRRIRTLLPAPLTYPGMPADRFWEMEDAAVALGRVGAGPTDLARMLAIDFAVVFSPDWFLAPVEVPVGCVARVDWVVVRDTFGGATLVGTNASQAADGVGRQFQPSNLASADGVGEEGDNPLLVVLSSAMSALGSEPREEVALQRDEVANLVWSIEKQVMGPTGRGVTRPWFPSQFDLPGTSTPDDFDLVWRLATPVAETWTPMVAVHEDDGPRLLRKARLLDTATTDLRAAKSQLLADIQDVREEEVTRAGIQLRILEQHARGPDGRAYVWRGREKRPWKGEASSALRFDAATPRPST
jgi:hypothetical protein